MTRKAIKEMYRQWRAENGNKKPNRVIVKMHWEDEVEPDAELEDIQRVDTIGIVPLRKIGDTGDIPGDLMILFYVSSVKGLFDLMKPGNGSDFIVDEVLEFYKI